MYKSSDFCNIRTPGEKANAVNMVFKMLSKASNGEVEVDECLNIYNHLQPTTIFLVSTLVVDLGMVNHPYLVESFNNLVEKGVPPTEMGTATFDNIAGDNTKKCAPGLSSWQKDIAKHGSTSYAVPCGKKLADSYSVYLFNPFKQGDSKEGVLNITREDLLRLNPTWSTINRPKNRSLHIGVNKDGEILKTNKYYSYITFES